MIVAKHYDKQFTCLGENTGERQPLHFEQKKKL